MFDRFDYIVAAHPYLALAAIGVVSALVIVSSAVAFDQLLMHADGPPATPSRRAPGIEHTGASDIDPHYAAGSRWPRI